MTGQSCGFVVWINGRIQQSTSGPTQRFLLHQPTGHSVTSLLACLPKKHNIAFISVCLCVCLSAWSLSLACLPKKHNIAFISVCLCVSVCLSVSLVIVSSLSAKEAQYCFYQCVSVCVCVSVCQPGHCH